MNFKHRQIWITFQNWPIASNKGLWFSGEEGEGEFRRWVNNKASEKSFHKGGKKNGTMELYYSNGQLKLQGEWVNDEKEGEWKYWFKGGIMNTHCYYKNGELDGDYKSWDNIGDIISHSIYKNGNKIKDLI